MSATPGDVSLTEKETKVLAIAWISCVDPPKPNYQMIADYCGYANAASASVTFGNIRRKLQNAANATDSDATPRTTSAKKKRTAKAAEDNEETPSKPKRARKAKKDIKTKDEEDDAGIEKDMNAEEDPIKHIKSEEDTHEDIVTDAELAQYKELF